MIFRSKVIQEILLGVKIALCRGEKSCAIKFFQCVIKLGPKNSHTNQFVYKSVSGYKISMSTYFGWSEAFNNKEYNRHKKKIKPPKILQ